MRTDREGMVHAAQPVAVSRCNAAPVMIEDRSFLIFHAGHNHAALSTYHAGLDQTLHAADEGDTLLTFLLGHASGASFLELPRLIQSPFRQ